MFRNLTPHDVRERTDASNEANPLVTDNVYAKEPVALRIHENIIREEIVDGVRIRTTQLGEIEGLPEPVQGLYLIVSMPTAERAYALGRRDVVSPDTGEDAIRFKLPNGAEGIYAVRGFRFIVG